MHEELLGSLNVKVFLFIIFLETYFSYYYEMQKWLYLLCFEEEGGWD